MSELIKTIMIVIATIVVGLMAIFSVPRNSGTDLSKIRDKQLFPNVDVDSVQRVRIVKYDGLSTKSFEVSKTGLGGWVLPSKAKYPADNAAQVRNVVNFLPGLVVTNIASDREADKEKYGVIEPREAIENLGQKNVGTLVELLGEGDEPLASAVIGAKVAGDEEKSFVVKPGEPHIYVVELNQAMLSTEFKDWINNYLIHLDRSAVHSLNMKRVASVNTSTNPDDRKVNYEYDLTIGAKLGRWSIKNLTTYDASSEPLAVDVKSVSLKAERLNQLATSIDNLRIMDVEPKPEGLRSDVLQDKEFIGQTNSQISLTQHGFFVVPGEGSAVRIVSKGGQIVITRKDGVEYVLRFGDFAKASLDDEGRDNRYLMVSARLNESVLNKPVLDEGPTKQQNPDEESPAPGDADDAGSKPRDREAEKRKRDYLIKLDEYNARIADAKARVQSLNDRFGPWYYVISEDGFNQLTPTKQELIKQFEQT